MTDRVRKSNAFNSKGFYEHEKLRSWTVDEEWLNAQRGKAIKIVEPLIQDAPLPRGKKVVVRMNRALEQILQARMQWIGLWQLEILKLQLWSNINSTEPEVPKLPLHLLK